VEGVWKNVGLARQRRSRYIAHSLLTIRKRQRLAMLEGSIHSEWGLPLRVPYPPAHSLAGNLLTFNRRYAGCDNATRPTRQILAGLLTTHGELSRPSYCQAFFLMQLTRLTYFGSETAVVDVLYYGRYELLRQGSDELSARRKGHF